MSVIKELQLKDYVTLLGTMFGMGTILFSIIGVMEGSGTYMIAIASLMWVLAMTCDLLDGLVARKLKQSNQIGKELDSLSDAVSFVAAPAVLILCASLIGEFGSIIPPETIIIGIVVLVFGGITRLAWYNVANVGEGYTGLTTPLSAGFLSIFYISHYIFKHYLITDLPGYYWALKPVSDVFSNMLTVLIFTILMGLLNVAPFLKYGRNVQKRRGIWKWIIFALAALIIFTIAAGNALPGTVFASVILHFLPLGFFFCIVGYIIYGFYHYFELRRQDEAEKL